MRNGCIPSKNKFKTEINTSRWLASDTFEREFQTATHWVSYRPWICHKDQSVEFADPKNVDNGYILVS